MLGQASAIKARNQVSEYPPLSKLAGCFLCTTVLAAKIRQKSHFRHFSSFFFHIFGIFLVHIPLHPLILDLMLLTDASHPANATSCCSAAARASPAISPWMSSPRSCVPLVAAKPSASASLPNSCHASARPSRFRRNNSKYSQNSEHLFRLSPRQTLFQSCRGLFRGTFSNFAAKPLSIQIDWQNEISVYN